MCIDKILYSIFLFFLSCSVTAQLHFSDPDDLVDAINSSTDGGVFVVTNGTYNDFEATIEIIAAADDPIVIKAETIGGVILTGESNFVIRKSAFVTLK